MRVGWAFFGLAVVVLVGYCVNRGVYVGSSVLKDGPNGYYRKHCRFLFPSGTVVRARGGWFSAEQANNEFCPLFYDSISN